MGPWIAFFGCIVGIGGLFYLDRDDAVRTAKALWLPVIWLWISGSRPPSAWLGMSLAGQSPGQLPATSVLDQSVAGILILTSIIVVSRRREVGRLIRSSWPMVAYFSFCLISLLWSDFPEWGFKRWIRSLGDLVMVLIVITDAQRKEAFRRLFSRVGFVVLPASVLLIKYFPELGRGYDQWGAQWNTGVTTNKNMLGVLTYVLAIGALWQVLTLLRSRKRPHRIRRLLAQSTLLCFGIDLLFTAHSATSGACFVLGAGLMLVTALPFVRRRPSALHALVLTILLSGVAVKLFGGQDEVVQAMGRNPDFTGRADVWKALLPMAPNRIVGAGFETFWIGPRVERLSRTFVGINEAHNGYLEVYLNLGLLGLGLIIVILWQGYRNAIRAFGQDPAFGVLLVAYIVTTAIYSLTEAGFRMLGPAWFFLLLAVAGATGTAAVGKASARSRQELP